VVIIRIVISIRRKIYEEIMKKLREEFEYYEEIVKKFEKKYDCSLEELEKKIEREGVSIDNHEIWEDSIEWRNAVEELEKLKKLLEELK
jgi:arginyl-tRNA synthetase